MSEIAKREAVETTREATDKKATGEGVRVAQGRFLDELPGAVFAVVTLVWIFSSFAGLIWRDLPGDLTAHAYTLSQLVLGSHTVTMLSRASTVGGVSKRIYDFINRNPG